MSDISAAHSSDSKSTGSALKSEVDWTVVGSNPESSPAQSATSPSPPLLAEPSSPSDELATLTPSSPAQSLAESEEANPQSLSSLATDDLISPIATPLPASPVEDRHSSGGLDKDASTPIDSEWARSKLAISEGEDDGKSSISASDTEPESEKTSAEDVKNDEEKGKEDVDAKVEEAAVPSLVFTKPTLSGNEVVTMVENSELPYVQPKKEDETSDESDKTDVPPLVNGINTRLAPTFLQDTQDHLFASPTTTNNAAPNSAVSPKTSSFFFDTSPIRSPPRQGGATIVELPSDADTIGAESEGPRTRSMNANDTQTSDEDEQDDQEKPSSHSTGNKTIPLISPVHSSDRPSERRAPIDTASRSPRPPHLSRKPSPYGVSTFSRDPSPAPRPRFDHRSRSSDNRRRIQVEEPSSTPRPDSFFRSRTFVSSSDSKHRKSRATQVEKKEEEEVKKPKSMSSLVEEIKGALAQDTTVYYTLKGVLAEYEEKRRSNESRDEKSVKKERATEKEELDPDVEFIKAEKEKFLRRQPVKTKAPTPVKSFSYTQTDSESSESEVETYKLPQHHRRSSSFLRQLVLPLLTGQPRSDAVPHHHKSTTVEKEPVKVRRAAPPHSPVYPSRLSPHPSHVPSSATRAPLPSTGAKSSATPGSIKLAKPSLVSALEASSRLGLEKQLTAVKGLGSSSAPRTTSSTSALRDRPDLSPQKHSAAKTIISPSRPLVHPPSTSKAQLDNGGRFILFDYMNPQTQVEQLVANGAKSGEKEKKSEGGRKRRLNETVDVEGRKKIAMRSARMGGKGKIVEKGKGKEKERENSISFDFDDFY